MRLDPGFATPQDAMRFHQVRAQHQLGLCREMYTRQTRAARLLAQQCSTLLARLNGGVVTDPEKIYQQALIEAGKEQQDVDI